MSTPLSDLPRYRPITPTPEQDAEIASFLERLAKPSSDPTEPEIPVEPSAPTAP